MFCSKIQTLLLCGGDCTDILFNSWFPAAQKHSTIIVWCASFEHVIRRNQRLLQVNDRELRYFAETQLNEKETVIIRYCLPENLTAPGSNLFFLISNTIQNKTNGLALDYLITTILLTIILTEKWFPYRIKLIRLIFWLWNSSFYNDLIPNKA